MQHAQHAEHRDAPCTILTSLASFAGLHAGIASHNAAGRNHACCCTTSFAIGDFERQRLKMFSRAWFCIFAATVLYIDAASAEPMQVGSRLARRNLGGPLKDWYLMKMTKNYFCTDTGRVIPVDPETGHMLLKGLRRRSSIDDFFHTSHATEHGICKDGK